jgi:hypothetical protein
MIGVPSAGFEELVQLMKASVDVSNRDVSGGVPVHISKYIARTMGWSNITSSPSLFPAALSCHARRSITVAAPILCRIEAA